MATKRVILAPSVPHSGLHFVYEQLCGGKYYRCNHTHTPKDYKSHTIIQGHFYFQENVDHWFNCAKNYKESIITLRHPMRVRAAWDKRYRNQPMPVREKRFRLHWDRLLEVEERFREEGVLIKYFHLDDPDLRYEEAEEIQHWLGIDRPIDWGPTKQNGCVTGTHDLEIFEDECPEDYKSYRDLYERTKKGFEG